MGTSTRPGDVMAGRYRLIDLLSESGGGRFWRARDAILERFVALHVIPEDDPRAPLLVEAARTSATVLDSRILRVLDAATEDGRCFVVNEWGTGISLDILVTHAGPLGPRRAAWLVADVAGAITTAHAAGVAHGRLNPENVLIDSFGSVRLIGLCVDAALHGLPPGDIDNDVEDLGGLLYCALTGTWPGPSGSIVPAAPRENDEFLSPRQVRAGVPKPLDALWREFDCTGNHGRRRWRDSDHPDVSSARAVAAELLAFVGDPTGMPEALAQSIPPINVLRPVWLPAVADPLPHDDGSRDDLPVVTPGGGGGGTSVPDDTDVPDDTGDTDDTDDADTDQQEAVTTTSVHGSAEPGTDSNDPPIPLVAELPTEPGMPVFGDDEDVAWLRTRSTPPPPPPPFEDPPERELFAPDPPDGSPVRRPRPGVVPPEEPRSFADALGSSSGAPNGFWPWDTDPGSLTDDTGSSEAVPGRSWLRLAMAVALALLLLMAVAVAFNLGRGRTVLGGQPDPDPTTSPSASPAVQAAVLRGVTATDFDPLGDGEEHRGEVGNLVDGDPATSWSTQTYLDQLGPPPGLKTGVGLILDLGEPREVSAVEVRAGEGRTALVLYVVDAAPTAAPTGTPVATADGSGRLALVPEASGGDPASVVGRYLVLWLTSLPEVAGDFRAELSEVVVRGR
ncbi:MULTISPECIES: protein kinase family protein [Nocardioides]|uniref:Protein kinase domain-containing protein n=1 Tax=Nocardioides vastitatis TaxID=2568655 RepID=A0ABW0ZL76_9ACTN|nr:protein kinase family protein [Nocardioides sp.]THI96737.1 hypothetical protein E7Z54_15825 [Nocardioides sp.]